MTPHSLLHPLSSMCFEDKIRFSASQNLSLARSKWFTPTKTESKCDTWNSKPPDFSLKLYRSVRIPEGKERKTQSTAVETQRTRTTAGVFLPKVLNTSYQRKDPPKFLVSYRPPDTLETEQMFVKKGKYPAAPYKNPKPHNFRPLDEDLPEFVTTYERDPGNLSLKRKCLDMIKSTGSTSNISSRDTKTRMDTYKPAEPRWDAKLILPLPPWPPKSASFTRHQRRRGAYSAFLDRVEEKLKIMGK